MDSKDRKYQQGIAKALTNFPTLDDWPDYIAFLNKLQRAISSTRSTAHWIPQDLDIAIILAKCLSPDLPSGVHQKTLEIYQLVFKELGVDALSSKVNTWIPGVLPIIQYASISVKSLVIQIYKDFLLTLPSPVLKPLIKPILSYLLCAIDDERSEFFEISLGLIDSFRTEIADESLFWQSVFMIIVTSDEKRLGALIWCQKRLPTLATIVPSIAPTDSSDGTESLSSIDIKSALKLVLTEEQLALIEPEPGLLIRSFWTALKSSNVLIQRGFFDLLIKTLPLDSTVLQQLITHKDLENLVLSVLSTILKKDMSLNRRVWTWLLGKDLESTKAHQEYFRCNGEEVVLGTLLRLMNGDYFIQEVKETDVQKIEAMKIVLAMMDKWEIGSIVVPRIFRPFLKSVQLSADNEEVAKSALVLFDSVETHIIFKTLFNELESDESEETKLKFFKFIFEVFNFQDEEIQVHQLPLLLLSLLLRKTNLSEWFSLVKAIISLIPARAFLPVEHANLAAMDEVDVLEKIRSYYKENDEVLNLPFQAADLSRLVIDSVTNLVIKDADESDSWKNLEIYNSLVDLIPEFSLRDAAILELMTTRQMRKPLEIIQWVQVFNKFVFETPFVQIKGLQKLVHELCNVLQSQNFKFQIEVVKAIQSLTLQNDIHYVEAAVTAFLLSLTSFNKRLEVFNYLWIHCTDVKFLHRPLLVILDELNSHEEDKSSLVKTITAKWIQKCVENGFSNRLFQIVTLNLYESLNDFELFQYHCSLLSHILAIDDLNILKFFKEELILINSMEFRELNGYTFKDFTIWVIFKFMNECSNDNEFFNSKNLASVFTLLETLLGSGQLEINEFTIHLLKIFQVSMEFISNSENQNSEDYEFMSIVFINHMTNLIKLSNKHSKNMDSVVLMRASDDEQSKSLLIEFILSSFNTFNKPELLSTLLNLLNNLLKFQNELIFQYVDVISLSILNKINSLYDNDENSKDDVSISLLLTNLNEVVSLLRTYVITLEINDPAGSNTVNSAVLAHHNNPGFFTSVVSNVFNSDKSSTKDISMDGKTVHFRNVLNNILNQAIITSFKIWSMSDMILKSSQTDDGAYDGIQSLKYQSIKLKHKSKQLFESIFELEPIEVLKRLVLINEDKFTDGELSSQDIDVFKLLQALDGTRPQLTMPKIYKLFTSAPSKPTTLQIVGFLNAYTDSLQDDSIEDVFQMTVAFLKEVIGMERTSKIVLVQLLRFISILSSKLSHCKFGQERQVKKEINDLFAKLLPIALSNKVNHEILAAALGTINERGEDTGIINEDQSGDMTESVSVDQEEDIYKTITLIIPHIKHIIVDSDKQSALISSILVNLVTGDLKSKKFPHQIKSYQLILLKKILTYYNNVKSLRFLLNEIFNDLNFFKIPTNEVAQWNTVIKAWLNLGNLDNNANDSSSNEKLLELLAKSSQLTTSSAVNLFNWNDSEQNLTKLLNLRRISYILLISNKDQHIALLKEIFSKLDELLTQQNQQTSSKNELLSLLNSEVFIMLRVIVLKFSPLNLINYWTFIYTSLQRFFVNFIQELNDHANNGLKLNLDTVLQACKLLDVLLVLKYEDFQEWIFVIDTINAVFKSYEIISLMDKIAILDFPKGEAADVNLAFKLSISNGLKKPGLLGVKKLRSVHSLKQFFNGLSYYNYENIYDGVVTDVESILVDTFHDLFD